MFLSSRRVGTEEMRRARSTSARCFARASTVVSGSTGSQHSKWAALRDRAAGCRQLRLAREEAPGGLARDVVDVAVANDAAVVYPEGIEGVPVGAEALDVGHVGAPHQAV